MAEMGLINEGIRSLIKERRKTHRLLMDNILLLTKWNAFLVLFFYFFSAKCGIQGSSVTKSSVPEPDQCPPSFLDAMIDKWRPREQSDQAVYNNLESGQWP